MLKFTFLLIKQRLETKVPELKAVNWYLKQGTSSAKGTSLVLPAGYIRFGKTNLSSLGNGYQEGTLPFDIILNTASFHEDEKRINDPQATIQHMDLSDKIHVALSGWAAMLSDLPAFASLKNTPDDYRVLNTVDRKDFEPEHEMKAIMQTTQMFQSYIKDKSGNKSFQKLVAAFDIEQFEI